MPFIPDDQRLDGWKAIANFLGRERSTAIRWANERGLPGHRVPGGRTGTVYALRSELDAWLSSDRREATDRIDQPRPTNPGQAIERPTTAALPRARSGIRMLLIALAGALAAVLLLAVTFGRGAGSVNPPISIAAVASPTANRDTLEFARGLNADLARFANASPDLAVFEREPGVAPETEYAVRTEIERADGAMVATARLIAVPRGQVIWSRRFNQSGPALSALREQVAANLVDVLRCSFRRLEAERAKVRPVDLEQLMAICQSFEASDFATAEARARHLTNAHPDLSLGWALLAMIQGEMVAHGNPSLRNQALANSRVAETIAPGG